MTDACIALGSNLGDRRAHLDRAVEAIRALPGVESAVLSGVYETAPVGPQDQGAFLNAALRVRTRLDANDLLTALLRIEWSLGRPAREERRHWGPREIDLDLLLFGEAVIDEPGLTVPHPRLHERWFALRPLADVAGDWPHPVLGLTMAELLAAVEADQPTGAVS